MRILNSIKSNYSYYLVWIFIPIVIIISFSHHRWVNPEGLIDYDVKSYYAYLPALFIHGDLTLSFIDENPKEYGKWFWPVKTPTGKRAIVTSMGLSFLYMPFFLIAHSITGFMEYAQDGYSVPYAFALHFSALFYVIIGLFFLRKLLLKYFNQLATTITIILVFFGTNLLFYTAYVAPMAHAYNFGLICIYLFYIDKWYIKTSYRNTIILGLLSGLITLIRPTNILVLLVFFFWNTFSIKSLVERIALFIKNYRKILLMIAFFILVWIPQFIYWMHVSGKFLYFSYGDLGASFYWLKPQIFEILLSYRKGWWVYTPLMLISTLSIFLMLKEMRSKFLAIFLFLIVNIYVQASWWCWWFGGSFGLRAFVDSYAIMAIPIAVLVQYALKLNRRGYIYLLFLGLLCWYNLFQTKQYRHQALHYWWMSRTGYWMNFLKSRPVSGYWETVPVPDYNKARKGVYVAQNLIERYQGYEGIRLEPAEIVEEIKSTIKNNNEIIRYSKKHQITLDSAKSIKARNIYERKRSLKKYIKPLTALKIVDSLATDSLYIDKNNELKTMNLEDKETYLFEQVMEDLKKRKFNVTK